MVWTRWSGFWFIHPPSTEARIWKRYIEQGKQGATIGAEYKVRSLSHGRCGEFRIRRSGWDDGVGSSVIIKGDLGDLHMRRR